MILLRVACLVALATSAALFVDYTGASASFCSPGSGCAQVRASGFGYLPGRIPVPLVGILAYGAVLVLSLVSGPLRRRLLMPLSVTGGVLALAFLLIQALVVKQFCAFCVVVDLSALVVAGAGFAVHRSLGKDQKLTEPMAPFAWAVLAITAVAAPMAWPKLRPQPPVPPEIHAFYVPGKINVVEFADFQCPFCRMLHGQLKDLIKDYPGQVNFVRLNMPLERHAQALDAARAYVCAKAQGKGEEMADALFEAEELSPSANRRLAAALGTDMAAYDACLSDPKTTDGIQREAKILRAAGFQGLPTTYVGGRTIVGAQPQEIFRDAFERAARGEGEEGVPGPIFLGVLAAAGAAVIIAGRQRRPR